MDTPFGREGSEGGGRRSLKIRGASLDKTFTTALEGGGKQANRLSGGKNHTTAPLARGNAPLLPPAAASAPRESVSHDSQVASLPYESCSLATPEGEILAALYNERLKLALRDK